MKKTIEEVAAFNRGYIAGAKYQSKQIVQEIERRQQLIISEPDGIVRETMIANLLIDLK